MAKPTETDAPGSGTEHALSDVLDRLETSAHPDSTSIDQIIDSLGRRSFPAVILIPALLAVSPLSGVPGVTVTVGLLVAVTAAQMLWGRDCLWLPKRLARQRVSTERLCKAVGWVRRPVQFVERFVHPRLTFVFARPLVWLPITIMLLIGLAMPVLELIPTSGSISAAVISFLAAGLLTRDGLLILGGVAFSLALPLLIWRVVAGG